MNEKLVLSKLNNLLLDLTKTYHETDNKEVEKITENISVAIVKIMKEIKNNPNEKIINIKDYYTESINYKYLNVKLEIFVKVLLELGIFNIETINFNNLNDYLLKNKYVHWEYRYPLDNDFDRENNIKSKQPYQFKKSNIYRVLKKIKK